ncbi:MAG: hypothetical protein HQK49_07980 [Oligoflexia bacterium]|nr:hypothetical protein [Oligoflexia bacterium]
MSIKLIFCTVFFSIVSLNLFIANVSASSSHSSNVTVIKSTEDHPVNPGPDDVIDDFDNNRNNGSDYFDDHFGDNNDNSNGNDSVDDVSVSID